MVDVMAEVIPVEEAAVVMVVAAANTTLEVDSPTVAVEEGAHTTSKAEEAEDRGTEVHHSLHLRATMSTIEVTA